MSGDPTQVRLFQPKEMSNADFQDHVINKLGDMHEAIGNLAESMPTPEALKHAVAEGLREVLADPEAWRAARDGMNTAVKQEVGGWLLSSAKAAFSKLAWLLVIGMVVYQLGGWSAVSSLFKATTAQN